MEITREESAYREIRDMFQALIYGGVIELKEEYYKASAGYIEMYLLTEIEERDNGEFNHDDYIVKYDVVEGYESNLEIVFEWCKQ